MYMGFLRQLPKTKEKHSIRIVGVRKKITEDMEENQRFVPTFWKEFLQSKTYSEICRLSNHIPYGVLGVTAYQNPAAIYYYIAASTDEEVLEGMFEYEIPAATWVIFESEGHFKETIQSIFKRFLTEWLPFSGYTYAELADIEVYPLNKENYQSGHMEVWIAIRKEKKN